ncbi:MAG TPA: aminotransferase class V-fold PLP-dependent enzyme [Thermomicrobiaceae bacterium]|nr:aminotransferase class V-fold PLP-dependent enzyme [Thermomicrobiaceae bacterium]
MSQTGTDTAAWADLVAGADQTVPLIDGTRRRYVNLDNAASTPPLRAVRETVDQMADWYSSVHRGSGYKSQLSTALYDRARDVVLDFVHADPRDMVAVFAVNTTDALNRLAFRLALTKDDVILTSVMEHHSNMLPWRDLATTVYVRVDDDGRIDLDDLEENLRRYGGRVRLVAVTGASNLTGYTPPVHRIAELAHAHGAEVLVDAAQLAAHRAIDVRPLSDPGHIDYLAISAHKMYAPYGSGALIANRRLLETGRPYALGGGIVDLVTLDEVLLSGLPDREEAGSPNVIGAVALAKAIQILQQIGMDAIASHEQELTAHALRRFQEIPALSMLGSADPSRVGERVGVLTFNLRGVHHGLAAAVLGHEYGIAVRHGCFCAHPYLIRLLKVDQSAMGLARASILRHDKSEIPGGVRASIGIYNTTDDIDLLVDALTHIVQGSYRGTYRLDRPSGDYEPEGYALQPTEWFPL